MARELRFRSFSIIGVTALALAGCIPNVPPGTGGMPPPPIITKADIDNAKQKVVDYTTQVCRFVPAADTVAHILDAIGYGYGVSAITQAGSEICAAINAPKAARGGAITVRGVKLRGHRV